MGGICFAQVVEKLIRGLAMEDSRNMFALFEHNNNIDKAVESRTLVADVLAKFERYDHQCNNCKMFGLKFLLYFKIQSCLHLKKKKVCFYIGKTFFPNASKISGTVCR